MELLYHTSNGVVISYLKWSCDIDPQIELRYGVLKWSYDMGSSNVLMIWTLKWSHDMDPQMES